MNSSTNAPKEQLVYADILFYGCWAGMAFMLIAYFLYVLNILPPYVSMDMVIQYWSHSAHDYLEATKIPTGWKWFVLVGKGDFLNLLGIAMLAALTIVGFVYLVWAYIQKKDIKFTIISCIEVLVLVLAASGIVGGGAH
jgi:hypothetical protein